MNQHHLQGKTVRDCHSCNQLNNCQKCRGICLLAPESFQKLKANGRQFKKFANRKYFETEYEFIKAHLNYITEKNQPEPELIDLLRLLKRIPVELVNLHYGYAQSDRCSTMQNRPINKIVPLASLHRNHLRGKQDENGYFEKMPKNFITRVRQNRNKIKINNFEDERDEQVSSVCDDE